MGPAHSEEATRPTLILLFQIEIPQLTGCDLLDVRLFDSVWCRRTAAQGERAPSCPAPEAIAWLGRRRKGLQSGRSPTRSPTQCTAWATVSHSLRVSSERPASSPSVGTPGTPGAGSLREGEVLWTPGQACPPGVDVGGLPRLLFRVAPSPSL